MLASTERALKMLSKKWLQVTGMCDFTVESFVTDFVDKFELCKEKIYTIFIEHQRLNSKQ